MASIANITVFDGQSTPVSHTLIGESVARDSSGSIIATYKEAVAGVPDYAQVRATIKRQRLSSGVNRVSARVEIPVMESVSGQNASGYTAAPKVAYTDTVEVVGFFHDRSVISGRRSVRQMATNLMNNITTSVAAATSGPVPDAFDTLIMPT